MSAVSSPPGDSPDTGRPGGAIPGLDGECAFCRFGAEPAPIPVVLAAPHGGRRYPHDVLQALRVPAHVLLRLEDRLVDALAEAVAAETGAPLLVAHAPRAMIDLNRAVEDCDWDMISAVPAGARTRPGAGERAHRARNGLGLIPRRLPGIGELWRARLAWPDLAARIASIHRPYHAALAAMLGEVRDRWGACLLIDLHSMPPLSAVHGPPAQFVVGDRFGTACDGELIASMFAHLAANGCHAAHNRPYAGGYVLDRHAARSAGIHAVQLEIDRSVYLDAALCQRGSGFDATVTLLVALVRRLAGDVAALGRDRLRWRSAAE